MEDDEILQISFNHQIPVACDNIDNFSRNVHSLLQILLSVLSLAVAAPWEPSYNPWEQQQYQYQPQAQALASDNSYQQYARTGYESSGPVGDTGSYGSTGYDQGSSGQLEATSYEGGHGGQEAQNYQGFSASGGHGGFDEGAGQNYASFENFGGHDNGGGHGDEGAGHGVNLGGGDSYVHSVPVSEHVEVTRPVAVPVYKEIGKRTTGSFCE